MSTYPLDVARTRIAGRYAQNSNYGNIGLFRTVVKIYKEEGFRAFYQGAGATVGGALPYEGIKFSVYGTLKKYNPHNQDLESKQHHKLAERLGKVIPTELTWNLCSGALGGIMAGMVMFPNDTVRKLLQYDGAGGTKKKYKHTLDCWRVTYREEGVRRFYRGVAPYLIRMAPSSAIQFGTFEFLKSIFYTS